jgi:cyclohexanecarboxylate-CoA ligase
MLEAGNLWELVERRAAATPDAEMAVDETGDRMTFGEYRAGAERVAAGLAPLGVGPGTVVSWQLPTWPSALLLVAALARLSAVQNPIIPIYREREVGFVTRQAGTRLLITPSYWGKHDFGAMAEKLAEENGFQVLIADRKLPEGDPATLPPAPAVPASPADAPVRWLFYTSGTTSVPKGARHTDPTVAAAARGMSERLRLTAGDRSALVFPFTHIGGITWLFSSLLVGFANILTEAFNPQGTSELLRRERVTMAGAGTYFHLAYLAEQRKQPAEPLFAHLRGCPGGGGPRPPALHGQVKAELGGAGVLSGWGLTEAPILSMSGVDDPDDALAATEGKAMPGVELRVVALDGSLAGRGEEGELRARAPQTMKGYVDSSLDAEAFDADGFFRTGDLGRIDERGYLTITGRLKDIIIRKGENISAKEVEDLLFEHPAVTEASVVGLPDPEVGERCCAVVVPARPDEPLRFEDMVAFLSARGLMKQKLPERLEIVDALPRNPAGKVLKNALRERYST